MERLTPAAAAERLLAASRAGQPLAEIVGVSGPASGLRMLVEADGVAQGSFGDSGLDEAAVRLGLDVLRDGGTRTRATPAEQGECVLFANAHRPPEHLVVVGAGHIAVPLAELGDRLGFTVTVLDDRDEFATAARFPVAARVLQCDFESDPFAAVQVDARTYVALVTRGHRWDFDCLRRLVTLPARPRYIGMIGSRRRVRAALHALLEAGVDRQILATIRAPIGVEIGAETPEEIAVSIAAEIIAVRRAAEIETMTARERVLDRLLPRESESTHG